MNSNPESKLNPFIFRGVKVENNVTIGANSVVINDIPDHCIAVGIPAAENR